MTRAALMTPLIALLLSTLLFSPAASAQELPSAQALFEDYIEAIGGRENLEGKTKRKMSGRFEGAPFEFPARLTVWQEAPDKLHYRIEEPAGLVIQLGYDGEDAWQGSSRGGYQYITGGMQLQSMIEDADFFGEPNYIERYSEISTRGLFQINGRNTYAVGATFRDDGRSRVLYFDPDSKLIVAMRVFVFDEEGNETLMTLRYDDYEFFDGVRYPTKVTQEFQGSAGSSIFIYTRVEHEFEDNHDFSAPEGTVRPTASAE